MARNTRKRMKRLILAAGAVAVLTAGGFVTADRIHRQSLVSASLRDDPDAQIEAMIELLKMGDARAAEVSGAILAEGTERRLLSEAAYVVARSGDRQRVPLILARADEGPDDPTRARLMLHAGRLAGDDPVLAARFRSDLESPGEPWRRVGAAVALLEMGYPEGGPALVAIIGDPDHAGHAMAYAELARVGGMMTEAVGWPITWPETVAETDSDFWEKLVPFWESAGTSRLLNDVLAQRYGADPRWRQLRRLLHARNKVARWFE